MSPSYNPRVDLIYESPTRRIDELKEKLAREGKDVILLSTGQPSIPPPEWVRSRLAEELRENSMRLYSYTPTRGRLSVLEAILNDLSYNGVELTLQQVTLTAGGQSALFSALSSLFRPGDEVIVFDPMYFGYWPLLSYLGIKPLVINESLESGFQPEPDVVNEVVNRGKTKGLIIVTPDNPTGRVVSHSIAKGLAEIAIDNDLWLIIDEAYRTLIYEGSHYYFYNTAPENTVALGAFSKDPGIPGWRLGYAYGPKEAIRKIALVVQETVYNPPSIAQRLVEIYLSNPERRKAYIEYVVKTYKKKRDIAVKALKTYLPDASFIRPAGGMFIFIDLSKLTKIDSESIAKGLLTEKNVAVVPGEYFSKRYRSAIRISFVSESEDRIKEGIMRISEYLNILR